MSDSETAANPAPATSKDLVKITPFSLFSIHVKLELNILSATCSLTVGVSNRSLRYWPLSRFTSGSSRFHAKEGQKGRFPFSILLVQKDANSRTASCSQPHWADMFPLALQNLLCCSIARCSTKERPQTCQATMGPRGAFFSFHYFHTLSFYSSSFSHWQKC